MRPHPEMLASRLRRDTERLADEFGPALKRRSGHRDMIEVSDVLIIPRNRVPRSAPFPRGPYPARLAGFLDLLEAGAFARMLRRFIVLSSLAGGVFKSNCDNTFYKMGNQFVGFFGDPSVFSCSVTLSKATKCGDGFLDFSTRTTSSRSFFSIFPKKSFIIYLSR